MASSRKCVNKGKELYEKNVISKYELVPRDILESLTVDKIMTPENDFVYYEDEKEKGNLENTVYDVLILQNKVEYWYKKDREIYKISPEEIIPAHIDLLSLILDYMADRDFYFVTTKKGIDGIVHFSDLKKQPVRILFYIMISTLELQMRDIYSDLKMNEIEEYLCGSKNGNERYNEILERYKSDKSKNQELNPVDYLYFTDFINILEKDKMFKNVLKEIFPDIKPKKLMEGDIGALISIRNWIAHPTKDLPDNANGNNTIKDKLQRAIYRIFCLYYLLCEFKKIKKSM